jgi:hypothetical protein
MRQTCREDAAGALDEGKYAGFDQLSVAYAAAPSFSSAATDRHSR